RGLALALPREVRLGGEGLPDVQFDAASTERLRAVRAETVAAIRNAPKGSAEHRALGKKMRSLQSNLAVLELHQTLAGALRREDAKKVLLALRPVLPAAETALKKLGAQGSCEATRELRHLSQD